MLSMLNIKQVSEKLGVSEAEAYGLMQFLKAKGAVTVTSAPSDGKRGRRPCLYSFNGDTLDTLFQVTFVQLIESLLTYDEVKEQAVTAKCAEAIASIKSATFVEDHFAVIHVGDKPAKTEAAEVLNGLLTTWTPLDMDPSR